MIEFKNPTPLKNAFIVLHLDFSTVDYTGNLADIMASFDTTCNTEMKTLVDLYRNWFQNQAEIDIKPSAIENLKTLLGYVRQNNLPPLYVIIDEYFCDYREIPKSLTDMNLRTDLPWVRRITAAYEGSTEEFVNQLLLHNTIRCDDNFMMAEFDMRQFFHKSF